MMFMAWLLSSANSEWRVANGKKDNYSLFATRP
jgi:hypothetical protein